MYAHDLTKLHNYYYNIKVEDGIRFVILHKYCFDLAKRTNIFMKCVFT